MHFTVLTIMPDLVHACKANGIIGKAFKKNVCSIDVIDIRKHAGNKRVDDVPFGGGSGMVMKYEPINLAIQEAFDEDPTGQLIFPCPTGEVISIPLLHSLLSHKRLVFLCGRYEGIDARIIEKYNPKTISAGDFILSGGELPVMLIIDALTRLVPTVLNNPESLLEESFEDDLLGYPQYTRPRITSDGLEVPSVLLSGNHGNIKTWRHKQRLEKTYLYRKDLLERASLTDLDKQYLKKYNGES